MKLKRKIKNTILKTITTIALLGMFLAGTIEGDPLLVLTVSSICCGWVFLFSKANGFI